MAAANEVDIMIRSKADTSGIDKATKSTKDYNEKLDATGEKAGDTETRIIGVHDVIDGTATVMQGPGQQGMVAYIQGWADIAGGVEGVLPLLKAMSISAIKNAATQVAQGARTVGAWLAMRATAMASAVQMAAAWVISLGPIALIIGAITVITGLLVTLWVKSTTFRNIVTGAFDKVKESVHGVWQWIVNLIGKMQPLIDAILKVIKIALTPYRLAWDAITGSLRKALEVTTDFLEEAGILKKNSSFFFRQTSVAGAPGGVSSGNNSRPGFARGGISPGGWINVGERGQEQVKLPAGMAISSNSDTRSGGGGGGGGYLEIRVTDDGSAFGRLVADTIRKGVRHQGGGSVQRYLGFAS